MRPKIWRLLRKRWHRLRAGYGWRVGPFEVLLKDTAAEMRHRAAGNALAADLSAAPEGRISTRSVVFLHHAYYNFYYLARALRERGWDAVCVSLENPEGPNSLYYHGEDVNLYDADDDRMYANIQAFVREVPARFQMVHFYGIGRMSFFPIRYDYGDDFATPPQDFMALRQAGVKIGYSTGGCNHGISQTAFRQWSGGCCDRCIWQHEPRVCSDRRNLAWGHKVEMFVDLHATEGNPMLDYQGTQKCYREPLTTALDPDIWSPDLEIPADFRLPRNPGEVIVYHAVGNYSSRANEVRNIKGTPAVVRAIERLQKEGHKVRLEFRTGMRNLDLRFIQAQSDIIVDQLNFGRYGATAREGLMLGKPTVCLMNLSEPEGVPASKALSECPLVSASESTVYRALRDLVVDPDARRRIGEQSRRYALKWHSAEACAARFEKIYDRLMDPEGPGFQNVV